MEIRITSHGSRILVPSVTHAEFVDAYARGELRVEIDPQGAGRFLSARLILPLIGWIYSGLAVIALGIVIPRLIKRSAPYFLLQDALRDPAVYEELTGQNILRASLMDKR
jgi:hypothetical protein